MVFAHIEPMPERVTCPQCRGKGFFRIYHADGGDEKDLCRRCDGERTVPKNTYWED